MIAVLLALAVTAPPPTSGRCAGAWNASGPAAAKAAVAARGVRQATAARTTVGIGVVGPGVPPTTAGAGCAVTFFLSARRTLAFYGTWSAGVVAWHGPLYRTSAAPLGSGNACVAADGTIHHVGRFDARTRCS